MERVHELDRFIVDQTFEELRFHCWVACFAGLCTLEAKAADTPTNKPAKAKFIFMVRIMMYALFNQKAQKTLV
ncbi:hypothetical protein GCM10028827_05710 [Mucilaginibacter myungsuensis]